MKSLIIYSSVLIFFIAVHPGWTKVIYVNHAAIGENNGSSWTDAYVGLQDALDPAEADDEIWVATGRYIPGTTRQSTFQLKENVTLYGGFFGTESERDQRDWVTNTTVLSGDINGDDSIDFSNTEENVYHVVTGASNAILDGFTVSGGNANGDDPHNGGGGMFNVSTALSVINCTFTKNQAKFGGGMLNIESSPLLVNCVFTDNSAEIEGGAIHNFASSSPSLTSCIIKTNVAEFGGGMMNNSASPTVVNCFFEDNTAKGDGGGIYNLSSSLLKLSFCTIRSNTSRSGGGVVNNASSPSIENCLFLTNSVENSGGAMLNASSSSPDIDHCRFIENSAGKTGGAMLNFQSVLKIANCTFVENSADEDGGAIANFTSSPVISNCIFSENFAGRRGGSLLNHTSAFPNVINCTFSRNIAKTGSTAVDNRIRSFPVIRNSIFWDDRPELASSPIVSDSDSGATVTYSCVQFGYFGLGNTNLNPRFINSSDIDGPDGVFGTKDDGLNLQTNSPCINAGTREKAPAKDISGLSRPQGNFFDMGSFEVELSADQLYTISGNVQYSGSQTGPIILQVQHSTRIDKNPNAKLVLPNEGTTEFEFPSIDAGTYYVLAFVDLDGDGQYDFPEPRSVINEAVSLLNSITDLSVTIVDISPIVYVNQLAGGANNGTSWDDAFIELSDALTYRVFGQQQIWVAQGTYTPTRDGDRFKSFRIPEGVALYGGFLGNESVRDHRSWLDHPTILSGDLNGDDGANFANNDDNVYHVVMGANRIRLEGFIVSGGNADGGSRSNRRGGGIYSGFSSSSTVANCIFRNNSAWLGGGMYTTESTTKIDNCSFTQNLAAISGGGMCNEDSSPVLASCSFVQNKAEFEGGGIYNDLSSPTLRECDFTNNSTTGDGGGVSNWQSTPKLTECEFAENLAGTRGGGMFNAWSSSNVNRCVFRNNNAESGGGITNHFSDPTVVECTFRENRAEFGGGMDNRSFSSPIVNHCIFDKNEAEEFGGGMSNVQSYADVKNCVFKNNSAELGGGVLNFRASSILLGNTSLNNCMFLQNSAAGSGGGMMNLESSSPEVANCVFERNTAVNGGGMMNSFSAPKLTDCRFSENHAESHGGGMQLTSSSGSSLTRCIFQHNVGHFGGALANVSASPVVSACSFIENQGDTGGGMYNSSSSPEIIGSSFSANTAASTGGGLNNALSSSTLRRCVFSSNTARFDGGGISNNQSTSAVTNSIFSENIAGEDVRNGGGINNFDSSVTVTNCTFNRNLANGESNSISNEFSSTVTIRNSIFWEDRPEYAGSQIFRDVESTVAISHSCVQFGSRDNGNIDLDPDFVAPSNAIGHDNIWGTRDDGLRLTRASPAINTGSGEEAPSVDVADVARPQGDLYDMGAYEYPLSQAPRYSISGTLSYFGNQSGVFILQAYQNPQFSGMPVGEVNLGSGSDFQISGLSTGTYYILAYIDVNGNGSYDFPEPRRILNDPITITQSVTDFVVNFVDVKPIVYVNASAMGENNGTSWVSAFTELSDALNFAIEGQQEIWVAGGSYRPTSGDDRSQSFRMREGIAIYGGFSGNEDSRDERRPETYLTILSGDLNRDDGPDFENMNDNAYHVLVGADQAILDGFIVTGGNASGFGIIGNGGGMINTKVSPTISRCIFVGNTGKLGSAMHNSEGSQTSVVNCIFTLNKDQDPEGGVMTNDSSAPTVINCTFIRNLAGNEGGGINDRSSASVIRNSIFWEDRPSHFGSQIRINNRSTVDITNSCIQFGYGGPGNIDLDPRFVDPSDPDGPDDRFGTADDGFRLQPGSPCINTATAQDAPAEDAFGTPRPQGEFIDMGAYELTFSTDQLYSLSGEVQYFGSNTDAVRLHLSRNSRFEGDLLRELELSPGEMVYEFSPLETGTYYLRAFIDVNRNGHYDVNEPRTITNPPILLLESIPDFTLQVFDVTPVVYVDASATGNNNGLSWTDAFTDLSDALTAAVSGQEIWVAAGIYRPSATNGRHSTFRMQRGVDIFGGFSGRESSRDDRDWVANKTILSGDLNGNDAIGFANYEDNVFHVVTGADESTLSGFVITGGNANGSGLNRRGGGLRNNGTSPAVTHCSFERNFAVDSGGGLYNLRSSMTLSHCTFHANCTEGATAKGGGMLNAFSSVRIANCRFSENHAGDGGGIFNSESDSTVTDCVFSGNTADNAGGGIINAFSSITLSGCIFAGNEAIEGGGGGMSNLSSFVDITDSFFHSNTGPLGGALANSGQDSSSRIAGSLFYRNIASLSGGGMSNSSTSLTIQNCTFTANTSDGLGGGMANLSSPTVVEHCYFSENSALFGGAMVNSQASPSISNTCFVANEAIDFGGGMVNNNDSNPTILNCIFQANKAPSGGAIYNDESSPSLINCSLSNNSAEIGGDAMSNTFSSFPELRNSVFWTEEVIESGKALIENFSSTPRIQACNIKGANIGEGDFAFDPNLGDDHGDNIDENPLSTLDGHLQRRSPCIDRGVDGDGIPDTDWDQEQRPDPDTELVDMGSDEFIDSDGDGLPDWVEVQIINDPEGLDSTMDHDQDGLSNLREYELSTNPANPDSDLDGIIDGQEVLGMSNPSHPDTLLSPHKSSSTFVPIKSDEQISADFLYAILTDVDKDRDLDLVYSDLKGVLWFQENGGTVVQSSWQEAVAITDNVFTPFAVGDLKPGGNQEVVILADSDLAIIEQGDNANWQPPRRMNLRSAVPFGSQPHALDIDKDGDVDVVLVHINGQLSLVRNDQTAMGSNWSDIDPSWAGTTRFRPIFEISGDMDLDGDLDRFVGFDENKIPRFELNIDEHLLIVPRYLTLVQGERQQLETLESDHDRVSFSLMQNTSGGDVDESGLYIAGTTDVGVDVIRAVAEDGLSGLVVVNVISPEEADRNAKVLIVVGTRSLEDSLFSTSERLAMDAYVVCRQRGYRASDICLLTPNGTLSKSTHLGYPIAVADNNGQLETAIKDWASDVDDLILYFVDHGVVREGKGNLVLRPGTYLDSETLKAWLDDWQTRKAERTSLFIIDTCYSGHFVEELAFGSPRRIVMAASEPGALAHFQGSGVISFSQLFWDEIAAGSAIHEAFLTTVDNLTDTLDQVPLIDTNGDGMEEDIDGIEMVRSIGLSDLLGGIQRPAVGTVMEDVTIDESTATLWCRDVVSNNGILKVITYIVPPTLQTEVEGGSALTDMDSVELVDYIARRRIAKSDFESWQKLPEQLSASGSLTLSEENKDLLLSSYTEIEGIYVLNNDVSTSDLQRLRTIEKRLGYPPRYEADWAEFDIPGLYRILFFAEDNWGMLSTVRSAQITVEGPGKKAMIIECHGITDVDTPWPSDEIAKQAQLVRQTLHNRSFTAEDIQWFGPAHQAVSKASITSVFTSDFVEDIDELTLYLVGNATTEGVLLTDDSMLPPPELKGWLDILQSNSPCRVTVVVETDYSGSFLAGLANPDYERYVVTSTDSVNQTLRSSGLTFGNWFWGEIRRGRSIQQAFTRSKAIARASQIQPIPFSLDDDGNGTYERKKDGLRTLDKFIGTLFLTGNDEVQIGSVSESLVLEPGDSGLLFVKDAFSPDGAELRVTATVIQVATGEIMTADVLIMANAGSGHYQRDIHYDDFPEPGRYVVIIQATSLNDSALAAVPVSMDIFVGIAPPENNGAAEATYPRLVVDDDATAAELDDSGQDIYRLWAVVSQAITVEVENVSEGADVRLAILADPQKIDTPLEEADDAPAGIGELIFSWNPPDTGWYYVQVEAITVNEGPVSYSIESTSQHFGADGFEEDDIPEMAKWISWQDDEFQEHNFHDEGDEDWVFFFARKDASYQINVFREGVNCDVVLGLYEEMDGDLVLLQEVNQTQGNDESIVHQRGGTPGRHYVRIRHANPLVHNVGTEYRIRIIDETGGIPGVLMVLIHDNFLNEQLLAGNVSAAGLDPFQETENIYVLDPVPPGTYEVTVSVTGYQPNPASQSVDVRENDFTEAHFNLTPTSLRDRTVSLKKGWNMTSLPFIPRDNRVEALFQEHPQFGEVWSWREGRLQPAPRLWPMTGYWVYCHKQEEPLSIQGMDVIDTAKTFNKGWNLFGAASNTPLPETIEGPIWYWDDGTFKKAQTLEAGYGYWIYTDEPATIHFNSNPETD